MGVKSIIDIEVNDEAFKAFKASYDDYEKGLAAAPGAWRETGKEATKLQVTFDAVVGAMLAQDEIGKAVAKSQKLASASTSVVGNVWRNMARDTKSVASNIAAATTQLLKWTALTSVFSGLLGAGGLLGIDRMAAGAAGSRRSAGGLGVSIGEQNAFATDFGRFVDPDSFLARGQEAQTDVSKRWMLGGAQGNAAQAGVSLLQRARTFGQQNANNPALAQLLQANGLGQFFGVEDIKRLGGASNEEFNKQVAAYRQDRGGLGVRDETALAWQDLTTQLGRAGKEIENVFINGLVPLEPGLEKLSHTVAGVVQKWMSTLGPAVDALGAYIGSDKFQNDIKEFADDIGAAAKGIKSALVWLGLIPKSAEEKAADQATKEDSYKNRFKPKGSASTLGADATAASKSAWDALTNRHNPGNLKNVGGKGFRTFASDEEGFAAMAAQLQRDQYTYGQDTIQSLIYGNDKHGGYSTTDQAAYVKNLSAGMGMKPSDKLNLNDPAQLSKLIGLMAKQEGYKGSSKVSIVIENNTGGNAVVSASQLPQ